MITTFYPVIIPTLCRFEHFKRCVESLACNTHADKTELVIGLDYPPSEKYRDGYEKIKEFIPDIKGFGKVTFFCHKTNLGAVKNWKYCENYCFEHYDAFIGTEDDNEFSPCFLDFMNKALEKYAFDDKIESIGGWVPEIMYSEEYGCYEDYSSTAWGVGRWKHKEERYKNKLIGNEFVIESLLNTRVVIEMLRECPKRLNNDLNMLKKGEDWGDVKRGVLMQVFRLSQLRPCISLVRNIGNDGSGLHCKVEEKYAKQKISINKSFDIECKVASSNYEKLNELRRSNIPHNLIIKIAFYCVIIFKYLIFRVKHIR